MKLQEQSYYPFGLQMSGISDQAMGKLDSKNKFNGGVELEEDYGVNLYSTFFRKYDPQIGRFGGVDVLSESNVSYSGYQFALNDPIRMNDPLGNKQTPTGNGGSQDYTSQWEDIFNTLYYGDGGQYGGKWLPNQNASGGGYSFFSSDADAFMNGSMGMDWNHSWGNDGFATNFQDAQKSYYKNGGADVNVAALAPTIYTKGIYKNNNLIITNQADFDAQLARNAGMAFGNNLSFQGSNFGLMLPFGNSNIVPLSFSSDANYTTSKHDFGLISSSSYAGIHVSRLNETGLVNVNSVYTDDQYSGSSLTFLNTLTFSGNLDNLSGTVGVHVGGFEIHLGPTLLGGITMGASYSNAEGQSGGDATMSVGGLLLAPIRWAIPR